MSDGDLAPASWSPQRFEYVTHPSAGDTLLYLVRHGQTAANQRRLLQGSTDHPLDELGRRQVTLIADRLAKLPPVDAIITSPLQRAVVTASTIGHRLGIEPVIRHALTELDFGQWENREFTEMIAEDPHTAARFLDHNDFDVGWPGGETRRAFYDRVWLAFTAILDDYRRHRVIVVAHGGVLGAFLAMVQGRSPNDLACYDIKNCSLTELRIASDHTFVQMRNDVCHLEQLTDSFLTAEPTP